MIGNSSLIRGLAHSITHEAAPNTEIRRCLDCHTSTLQESGLLDSGKYFVYGASGVSGYMDEYMMPTDCILIVKDGSGVGTTSYKSGKISFVGTLNALTAKNGFSTRYLYYCLQSFNFEPYKTGMAIPHIYFKDYGKAKICVPNLEKQNKYAQILTSLDEKVYNESQILNNLIKQRSYLLTKMFI